MKIELQITTKSPVLTGSGEGNALIDSEVVFDELGLPFIPSRRLKGLLRESINEVLEIENGHADEAMLAKWLGEEGAHEPDGWLRISNFHPEGYSGARAQIPLLLSQAEHQYAFQRQEIQAATTFEIQQTAIDPDGVARDKSLRNYRILKPESDFFGSIEIHADAKTEDILFLKKALANLRYIGTHRNRGMGKIKIAVLKEIPSTSLEIDNTITHSHAQAIKVRITTLEPVVLAQQKGEQNTVFTDLEFSGNHVRGILAGLFRKYNNEAVTVAHLNEDFHSLFLSGNLRFNPCRKVNAFPLPLNLHKEKMDVSGGVIDTFNSKTIGGNTRPIGGTGLLFTNENGMTHVKKVTPETSFHFHNTRKDSRAAGKSMKDEAAGGGIFYYESLNPGQEFEGTITGDQQSIQKLLSTFPSSFETETGRSRSVQYGKIKMTLTACEPIVLPEISEGKVLMVAESPLILFNDSGFPQPDQSSLQSWLGTSVTIEKAITTITFVEQYNSIWASKSGKFPAFGPGSVFLLQLNGSETDNKTLLANWHQSGLGEFTQQGFGKVRILPHTDYISLLHLNQDDTTANEPTDVVAANQIIASNPLLKIINNQWKARNGKAEVQNKAMEYANRKNWNLNNHLLSRMMEMLKQFTNKQAWEQKIKALEKKPAGMAMAKVRIYEWLCECKLPNSTLLNNDLETFRIFWITFFDTLRIKNRRNNA